MKDKKLSFNHINYLRMTLTYCNTTSIYELKQIIKLQQKNLHRNLSEEERIKEGFVTVEHTIELLEEMHNIQPHIMVKDGDKLAGYALCMDPKFSKEIKVLVPMFDEIKKLIPTPTKYIIMGQICIAKEYRTLGLFRKLYATMQYKTAPKYISIITEVDSKNLRSMNAHMKIGFKIIKNYKSTGKTWNIIAL